MGTTSNDNNTLHTEVAVPLKYLSNFCRFLKECIISEIAIISRVVANPDADSPVWTRGSSTSNWIHMANK